MSATCQIAPQPVPRRVRITAPAPGPITLDFKPSRSVPRRMVLSWNAHTVAVSIFVRRCEDSVAYTSVRHAEATLDVVGSELPTYQLWLGASMFEVSYREYQVLRETLAPLGLRFRGAQS